jgi:hypothetical protein
LLVASSVSLLPHTGHGHSNGVSCEFSDRFPVWLTDWFPVLRGSRFSPEKSELLLVYPCAPSSPVGVLDCACRWFPSCRFSCRFISAVDSLVSSLLAQCFFLPMSFPVGSRVLHGWWWWPLSAHLGSHVLAAHAGSPVGRCFYSPIAIHLLGHLHGSIII